MLVDFLKRERKTILELARTQASQVLWRISPERIETGARVTFDQVFEALIEGSPLAVTEHDQPLARRYLQLGYAINDAVESFTILYDAIREVTFRAGYLLEHDDNELLRSSHDAVIVRLIADFEQLERKSRDSAEILRLGYLAHELRNTIQTATLAFGLVKTGTVGVTGRTSSVVDSSLLRMAAMIDTALTSVRMEMDPNSHPESIRVCDVIGEIEVTAEVQARGRDISISIVCDPELQVFVDRQLLLSALSNLVQNAIKYTHPHGTIRMLVRKHAGTVQIDVADECGGIPEGEIHQLFKPGVQLGDDRSGVGLGLSIARKAIERNKGHLTVANNPGHGCCFTIELPSTVEESS